MDQCLLSPKHWCQSTLRKLSTHLLNYRNSPTGPIVQSGLLTVWILFPLSQLSSLPFYGQHLSIDDCLEINKKEHCQNCFLLCCVLTVVDVCRHFLNLHFVIGSAFCVHSLSYHRSLYYCVLCFRCVEFSFFGTSQEIDWKERLQSDLFCVRWDIKPYLCQSIMPVFWCPYHVLKFALLISLGCTWLDQASWHQYWASVFEV